MLLLVVTADGFPTDIHEISQPLGYGLDEKEVEAAQQWLWEPGKKSGKPVAVQGQIEIDFHLPRQQ